MWLLLISDFKLMFESKICSRSISKLYQCARSSSLFLQRYCLSTERIIILREIFLILEHWLVSNLIPMNSKIFGFRNFDYIIRFAIKYESEIKKWGHVIGGFSRKNWFYEIETLTHNNVNTVSEKRNWTSFLGFSESFFKPNLMM